MLNPIVPDHSFKFALLGIDGPDNVARLFEQYKTNIKAVRPACVEDGDLCHIKYLQEANKIIELEIFHASNLDPRAYPACKEADVVLLVISLKDFRYRHQEVIKYIDQNITAVSERQNSRLWDNNWSWSEKWYVLVFTADENFPLQSVEAMLTHQSERWDEMRTLTGRKKLDAWFIANRPASINNIFSDLTQGLILKRANQEQAVVFHHSKGNPFMPPIPPLASDIFLVLIDPQGNQASASPPVAPFAPPFAPPAAPPFASPAARSLSPSAAARSLSPLFASPAAPPFASPAVPPFAPPAAPPFAPPFASPAVPPFAPPAVPPFAPPAAQGPVQQSAERRDPSWLERHMLF